MRKFISGLVVAAFAASSLGVAPSAAIANTLGPNSPEYWQTQPGEICVKDDTERASGGYTVPAEPVGRDWTKLILKKGDGQNGTTANQVFQPIKVGETYTWQGAAQGGPATGGWSHSIICSVPEPTKAPTYRYVDQTLENCEIAGVKTWRDKYTTTYTWDGTKFVGTETGPERVDENFVGYTDAEYKAKCAPAQPADKVVTSEWKDGTWKCGDTTVTQTRTVTTTPYVWDSVKRQWVEGTSSTTTETRTRPLTGDEAFPCPVDPTKVTPAVVKVDECGTANDSVRGVDNVGYTHSTTRDGLVYTTTFVANKGYVIEGQNPVITVLTNKDCPTPPPPPKDVCPNIDGPQSEVPAGHVMQNGNCVLPPPPPPVPPTPQPPVDACPGPNMPGNQPVGTDCTPDTVNPEKNPAAKIRAACTGQVVVRLDNTKSNVAVTFKYSVNGVVKTVKVKADATKTIVKKARAHSVAWVKAPGMKTVKTRVPGACTVPDSGA